MVCSAVDKSVTSVKAPDHHQVTLFPLFLVPSTSDRISFKIDLCRCTILMQSRPLCPQGCEKISPLHQPTIPTHGWTLFFSIRDASLFVHEWILPSPLGSSRVLFFSAVVASTKSSSLPHLGCHEVASVLWFS